MLPVALLSVALLSVALAELHGVDRSSHGDEVEEARQRVGEGVGAEVDPPEVRQAAQRGRQGAPDLVVVEEHSSEGEEASEGLGDCPGQVVVKM